MYNIYMRNFFKGETKFIETVATKAGAEKRSDAINKELRRDNDAEHYSFFTIA